MNRQVYFVLAIILLLSGCASEKSVNDAMSHAEKAHTAMQSGDWHRARLEYANAVVNVDSAEVHPRTRSILYYEYGRACGVTCRYDNAEIYLKKALELERSSQGPVYYPLLELGRLYLARRNYPKALLYFKEVGPILAALGAETGDPLGYADYLDDYSVSLSKTGFQAQADELHSQAAAIRLKNLSLQTFTVRTPYGRHCAK